MMLGSPSSPAAVSAAAAASARVAETEAAHANGWMPRGFDTAVDVEMIQTETEAAAEVIACRASVERLRVQRRQVETIKANAERKDRLILLLREQARVWSTSPCRRRSAIISLACATLAQLSKARDELVKFQSAWENQTHLQARLLCTRRRETGTVCQGRNTKIA